MTVFADSSALVKLYVAEEGADVVRGLSDLVVSQLARVEVVAALWRKVRARELAPADAHLLIADFEADYGGVGDEPPKLAAVAVAPSVTEVAARLAVVHGLRGYDAVQLASALEAARADPELTRFAAFDGDLREAAAAEGFALVP